MLISVMNKNKEKAEGKPVYWLHSLVVTILTSFGGGTVAPMLIGRPPFILSNDLILPITLVTWYIVHYIWGVHDLLTTTPARAIWSSLAALFRVHSGCNMTALAATILTAGPYYPCPAVGPVVVGTVVGSLGIFFPLDKGLAPIAAGTPWGTQQAFLVATFYHFMVTDKQGVIGEGLRAVVGTYSEQSTRVLLITLALATSLAQVPLPSPCYRALPCRYRPPATVQLLLLSCHYTVITHFAPCRFFSMQKLIC